MIFLINSVTGEISMDPSEDYFFIENSNLYFFCIYNGKFDISRSLEERIRKEIENNDTVISYHKEYYA